MVSPALHERIKARMRRIDSMSPALRALVHEEGLSVVDAFLQCGVTKARHIRHLIAVVRQGSMNSGPPSEPAP